MVQDWVSNQGSNYGMLVNSDPIASSDSNRFFSATESSKPDQRPKLVVSYSVGTAETTPPAVSGTTPTNDTTPTWTWTSGGGNGTFRYKLDNSDLTSGATVTTNNSYTPSAELSEGGHTLYVQEKNDAGEWSGSGSYEIVIDITPAGDPVITTNEGENHTTNDSSITLTGTCTDDTYAVYVNGSTEGVSYTPGETTWTYTGILTEQGDNTFDVTAYDAAENVSSADSIIVTYHTEVSAPTGLVIVK